MAVRIQFRRDAAATWTSENPTLMIGEMGLETDTGLFKVGDGVSNWTTLDYSSGQAGADGSTWHSDSGVPASEVGADGDYYLNITNGDIYTKTGGVWSFLLNIAGDDGIDGSTWYSGAGVPSSGLGVDGDYYLDTVSGDIYSKTSGTWSIDLNIVGSVDSPLTADLDFAGYKAIEPLIENYAEVVDANATAAGVVNLDLAQGNVHEITLFGDVTTVNLQNPATTGKASSMTLIVHQGGETETGTASAGADATLTDSTKNWDDTGDGEWEGWYVRIVAGTGAGQYREIASNTDTVLTVSADWDVNPSTDSEYEIYEAYSITWPAAVQWRGGSIPVLDDANATYFLAFVTTDAGGTWYGMEVGDFVSE